MLDEIQRTIEGKVYPTLADREDDPARVQRLAGLFGLSSPPVIIFLVPKTVLCDTPGQS